MAVESRTYWRSISRIEYPPEEWSQVVTMGRFVGKLDLIDWCGDDAVSGEFCWYPAQWLPDVGEDEEDPRIFWAFSDPQVAFEFKLRFG